MCKKIIVIECEQLDPLSVNEYELGVLFDVSLLGKMSPLSTPSLSTSWTGFQVAHRSLCRLEGCGW